MTLYQRKSFTVPASGKREAVECDHSWIDSRGACVLCGEKVQEPQPKRPLLDPAECHHMNRRYVKGVKGFQCTDCGIQKIPVEKSAPLL